jgi:hypothetical protein
MERLTMTEVQGDSDVKHALKSRTVWAGIIMAVVPLIPPLQALVIANPELTGVLAGLVVAGLRLVTDSKVTLKR